MMNEKYKPVVLVVLSGWGVAPEGEGNIISQADLPNWQKLLKNYPTTTLKPINYEPDILSYKFTASELGNYSLGTGCNKLQMLSAVDQAIRDESFDENRNLVIALEKVKKKKTGLHLVGLLGEGKVNASQKHLYKILEMAVKLGIKDQVYIHAILDGKDSPSQNALEYLKDLENKLKDLKVGKIVSLSGRYYAMDRNGNWGRTKLAYQAMAEGKSKESFTNSIEFLEEKYQQGVEDRDLLPAVLESKKVFDNEDSVVFFNFRPDYIRQLVQSVALPSFAKFERKNKNKLDVLTLVEIGKNIPVNSIFTDVINNQSLSKVISDSGLSQIKIAESFKYPHTTYFFNGLTEEPQESEQWKLFSTSSNLDLQSIPELNSIEITKLTTKFIDKEKTDFIVVNFAGPDVFARNGDKELLLESCQKIDKSLGDILDYTLTKNGILLVTSDGGNAEQMLDINTGDKNTKTTNNLLPLVVASVDLRGSAGPLGDPLEGDLSLLKPAGTLADVAPTILKFLGLKKPDFMSGNSLF